MTRHSYRLLDEKTKAIRDEFILRRKREGCTLVQIAAQTNLTPTGVNEVIRKARKAVGGQQNPNAVPVPSVVRRKLTDRQLEILKLIAKGMNNKEIANRLLIAEQTVKNQLYVAFRSIGATSRSHAIVILYQEGWLGK